MRTQSKWKSLKDRAVVALIVVALIAGVVWFYWSPEPATSVPQLPARFALNERVVNIGHTFDVEAGNTSYGVVTEKWFRGNSTFFYTDGEGKLVAYAKKAIVSFGTRINIYDGKGNHIGTLQKNVFGSLPPVMSNYSVLDANGTEVASSRKLSVITTSIELFDKSGAKVVDLSRPISVLSDTWNVTVHKSGVIDTRILVMIGAFKTLADSQ